MEFPIRMQFEIMKIEPRRRNGPREQSRLLTLCMIHSNRCKCPCAWLCRLLDEGNQHQDPYKCPLHLRFSKSLSAHRMYWHIPFLHRHHLAVASDFSPNPAAVQIMLHPFYWNRTKERMGENENNDAWSAIKNRMKCKFNCTICTSKFDANFRFCYFQQKIQAISAIVRSCLCYFKANQLESKQIVK